jgi:hypothetical protein
MRKGGARTAILSKTGGARRAFLPSSSQLGRRGDVLKKSGQEKENKGGRGGEGPVGRGSEDGGETGGVGDGGGMCVRMVEFSYECGNAEKCSL